MKKQLFVLLCCVLSMTATMAQSTNSNDDLLKQGVSNRQAKKEAQNKQDRQLYWFRCLCNHERVVGLTGCPFQP